jgi:hypothetical protein
VAPTFHTEAYLASHVAAAQPLPPAL